MPLFLELRRPAGQEKVADDDLKEELAESVRRAEAHLQEASTKESGEWQMGSTLTMAYMVWPRLYLVHAGDSRCYVFRHNELYQITSDHTVAQELVDREVMRPEAARRSRFAHVLSNAVLADPTTRVNPQLLRVDLSPGDTILLCTDGVSQHLDNEQIRTILRGGQSAEESVRGLIGAANNAGGAIISPPWWPAALPSSPESTG